LLETSIVFERLGRIHPNSAESGMKRIDEPVRFHRRKRRWDDEDCRLPLARKVIADYGKLQIAR
jgi:hypothetical protein